MITEEYEKLHREYLQCLIEYHNAYTAYIHGRQARNDYPVLRNILRKMKKLNTDMVKTLLAVKKAKMDLYKDKYQEQRTRNWKNVNNTTESQPE
jgi:hypothetical protein